MENPNGTVLPKRLKKKVSKVDRNDTSQRDELLPLISPYQMLGHEVHDDVLAVLIFVTLPWAVIYNCK